MATNNQEQGHSTLEYVPNEYYNKKDNSQPVYSGLQVVPVAEPGKELHYASVGGLEVNLNHDGLVPPRNDQHQQDAPRSRRKWLIIGAIIAVIVIVAAVVGGVMASKGTSSNKVQDSTASSATTSASPTGKTATPTSTVQPKRNIAAVSWSPNSGNQTRLYYQNNAGKLVESAISTTKTESSVLDLVSDAKPGSALAAAVSRPGFPLEISVFYMDASNLIHDVIYTTTSHSWTPGIISEKGYIAAPNSSLSALYNQCRFCANTTILTFQDPNNFIQVANRTSNGWQTTPLFINQLEDTGMGLQPFYRAGYEDQINLYYQRKDLLMAMASWKPSSLTSIPSAWKPDQTYSESAPNTPIAAAASYSRDSSGTENWIQTLSVAKTGITIGTWQASQRTWVLIANQHTVFSNSTSGKAIKAVAVTATGKAFGAASLNSTDSIESWQLQDDYVSWVSTGPVDIETAWT